MTDDLAFLDRHDDGRLPDGAKGRPPCRRHQWAGDFCSRCNARRNPVASRRGRSARRLGGDQERRIERVYGPEKIGERGDPVDHLGRVWKWQAKATRADPPLWLARITEPTQVMVLPTSIVIAYSRMGDYYPGRRPLVIRSYVHAGLRTRDWLFLGELAARLELGLSGGFGWWVIPGDWWLDHFGRDDAP